jgi:2'-5' RNA ligase
VRLFVAVWPPAEVLDALEGLNRPAAPGLRWTTRDQWHVTLRFLGSVDDPAPVAAALDDLSEARAVAVAGPATCRLGSSILVLPVNGLDPLAASVVAVTAALGEPPPDRPFAGHVTLARARRGRGTGEAGSGRDRQRVAGLAGAAFSASWEVGEVTLVGSTLHRHGARYDIVARYGLP